MTEAHRQVIYYLAGLVASYKVDNVLLEPNIIDSEGTYISRYLWTLQKIQIILRTRVALNCARFRTLCARCVRTLAAPAQKLA